MFEPATTLAWASVAVHVCGHAGGAGDSAGVRPFGCRLCILARDVSMVGWGLDDNA